MNQPELLAPAGDLECLKAALRFGADAVYLGGPLLQLRAQKAAFDEATLLRALEEVHNAKKKLYVTVNSFPKDAELPALRDYARFLSEAGVDAAIVSDIGAISVMKQAAPALPIHVSTQANCMNSAAARVYAEMGAERIVLAREMTLTEIAALHESVPEMELEAFVHGAMCVSYSGRCLLSSYLNGRSGNRGECTQPCRWEYYLVEQNRPNEFLKIDEEDSHTAILSSQDLCCISFLDELRKAGVSSFKIEGRMKTAFYVSQVVNSYRRAIDGSAALPLLENELEAFSHRPYNSGFYFGNVVHAHYNDGLYQSTCTFAGTALSDASDGKLLMQQRNFFQVGDTLEVVSPDSLGLSFRVEYLENEAGERVETACHPMEILTVNCPVPVKNGDYIRRRTAES